MPVSEKPRKNMKPRDKDPITLVLERGLRTQEGRVPILDEDGTQQGFEMGKVARPVGVVLGPIQTLVLANAIVGMHRKIEQLDAILAEALKDEDTDKEEADEA